MDKLMKDKSATVKKYGSALVKAKVWNKSRAEIKTKKAIKDLMNTVPVPGFI